MPLYVGYISLVLSSSHRKQVIKNHTIHTTKLLQSKLEIALPSINAWCGHVTKTTSPSTS